MHALRFAIDMACLARGTNFVTLVCAKTAGTLAADRLHSGVSM